MANVKEKEALPLMENPRPVPGQDPGFAPPPYSSSNVSQPQAYRPVPPPPTEAPYPAQMPMSENPAIYNPMGQATMDNEKPMVETAINPTYAPTTYPMENGPQMNQGSTSQAANNARRKARCRRYLKICSAIGTILVVAAVSWRMYHRAQHRKELAKLREEAKRKERDLPIWQINDYEQLTRDFVNPANYHNDLPWDPHNSRYRRAEPEDLKDYDFFDSIDQPFFDKLFKPEKSIRQRRDLETSSKKMKFGTRKKKYRKARKFTS